MWQPKIFHRLRADFRVNISSCNHAVIEDTDHRWEVEFGLVNVTDGEDCRPCGGDCGLRCGGGSGCEHDDGVWEET